MPEVQAPRPTILGAARHQQAQAALTEALGSIGRAVPPLGWSEGKAAVQVAHAALRAAADAVRNAR